MDYKATVCVKLKGSVLDPQGSAVEKACQSHGFGAISNVRIGKVITFEVDAENIAKAHSMVESLASQLLANPVMETYRIEIEEKQ